MQVYIFNNDKKDIIHFYNEVYIKVMKEYISVIKTTTKPEELSSQLGSRTP